MMTDAVTKKVETYFSQFPMRTYPKGQILIHSGDEPQHLFYIVSGKIRQYDITYRGDEIILNVFKPGAFFPILWALNQTPNRYFFDAETDVETRVAPYTDTLEFLKSNPDVLLDLLTRLSTGLDGLLGRMVHLMSGNAKSRLLYELVVECRRFGAPTNEGGHIISINEGDLAARVGLSRETVSREMQKIRRDGLVRVSHNGILVTNLAGLEERLETTA